MTDRAAARAAAVRDLLVLSQDTLLGRVESLETAAVTLLTTGELAEESQLDALTAAHQLISLGTFGIARGTTLAQRAEALLMNQPLPPGSGVELAEMALGLREAITQALSVPVVPVVSATTPDPDQGTPPAGRPRVLLIEDDPLLAELLHRSLEESGCLVTHAVTGPAGLEALAVDDLPNLVLLDIDLPGLDGHSVLRALRARGVLGRVSVVVLSARGSEQDVLQSLQLGAVGHIAKPFSLPVLLARVEQLLRRA